MNKVACAAVICSKEYREILFSVLDKNDVIVVNAVVEEKECLYDFVKRNTAGISNYDAIIIDLGVLVDTDEKIKESIEMLRFYDDKVRIIIFEGKRPNSYRLMHNCFLNGIYNLIIADNYINIRNNFEKCICQGMTYKESLHFRNEENLTRVTRTPIESEKKTIAFTGTQNRIGVTHCVVSTAYTLKSYGYLVAVVDCTGSTDYINIMRSYEQKLKEDMSFSIDDIDFYIKSSHSDVISPAAAYNFVLYDFGCYSGIDILNKSEKIIYKDADEKIMVCGAKAWEIPYLSNAIIVCKSLGDIKYLFNFSEPDLRNDLRKMMKKSGINEKKVYFMDFTELFQEVPLMAEMIGVSKSKGKKRLFGRKN